MGNIVLGNEVWSEEAENVVLGYLLIADTINDVDFEEIIEMFCSEDFYGPGNNEIYSSIRELVNIGGGFTADKVINHIISENKNIRDRHYNGPKRTEYLQYTVGEMIKEYIDRRQVKAYSDIVKARANIRLGKNVVDIFSKNTAEALK